MSLLAFILALGAAVAFLIDVVRSHGRSATAWGLLLLTVALVVQFMHPATDVLVR